MLTDEDKKRIEAYIEGNDVDPDTWLKSEDIEEGHQYIELLVIEKSKLEEYVYHPPSWGPDD